MLKLLHPWSAYERLQEKLARRRHVDDHTWGLEAGLNRLLARDLPAAEDVDRAVRSASRKERYRIQLRRVHLAVEDRTGNPEDALISRCCLRLLLAQITPKEWALLRAVGEGYKYKEIAVVERVAPGTLRARVLRLRRTLIDLSSHRGKVKLAKLSIAS